MHQEGGRMAGERITDLTNQRLHVETFLQTGSTTRIFGIDHAVLLLGGIRTTTNPRLGARWNDFIFSISSWLLWNGLAFLTPSKNRVNVGLSGLGISQNKQIRPHVEQAPMPWRTRNKKPIDWEFRALSKSVGIQKTYNHQNKSKLWEDLALDKILTDAARIFFLERSKVGSPICRYVSEHNNFNFNFTEHDRFAAMETLPRGRPISKHQTQSKMEHRAFADSDFMGETGKLNQKGRLSSS